MQTGRIFFIPDVRGSYWILQLPSIPAGDPHSINSISLTSAYVAVSPWLILLPPALRLPLPRQLFFIKVSYLNTFPKSFSLVRCIFVQVLEERRGTGWVTVCLLLSDCSHCAVRTKLRIVSTEKTACPWCMEQILLETLRRRCHLWVKA